MEKFSLITLSNVSAIIITSIESLINQFDIFQKKELSDDNSVSNFIKELDISHKMENVNEYINKAQYVNQFVKSETQSMKILIEKINEQVKIIEERLTYNKSVWLSIRKYKFNNRISELNALIKVLGERLCTLNSYSDINNLGRFTTKLGDPID